MAAAAQFGSAYSKTISPIERIGRSEREGRVESKITGEYAKLVNYARLE